MSHDQSFHSSPPVERRKPVSSKASKASGRVVGEGEKGRRPGEVKRRVGSSGDDGTVSGGKYSAYICKMRSKKIMVQL